MPSLLPELDVLNNLSNELRLKKLEEIITHLQTRIHYTPSPPSPKAPLSFLKRHPRLRLTLALLLTGLIVFCDVFVGVATILSGLMTFGVGIFILSIAFASLLMGLVVLLQLSAFSEDTRLSWLRPSEEISSNIQEYKLLRRLCELMANTHFYVHYQAQSISKKEYKALQEMINTRTQVIGQCAARLMQKNKSKWVLFCKGATLFVLGLSNALSGFSIGYFFAAALGICFEFLLIPAWVPLMLGGVLSLAVLLIFWEGQRINVFRMVERVFGCDKHWIEAMTQDMIPTNTFALSQLSFRDDEYTQEHVANEKQRHFIAIESHTREQLIISECEEHWNFIRDFKNGQNHISQRLSALSV